jgi:hypothetical protein
MNTISLVASVVSVIIAGFAIWLSVTFYKMSSRSSENIKKSADQIDSTVTRLESLFDKLYSDTFSMMKDTVSDMRKHIWKSPIDVEKDIDNKIKEEFSYKIEKLLKQQTGTDIKVNKLAQDIGGLLENALKKSRDSRKTKETGDLKMAILDAIDLIENPTLSSLKKYLDVDEKDLVEYIFELGSDKTVTWQGAPSSLRADVVIKKVGGKKS